MLNEFEDFGVNSVSDIGVKQSARINEPIVSVSAADGDLRENGSVRYALAASHLYKLGARRASGSVLPSPFNITQDGTETLHDTALTKGILYPSRLFDKTSVIYG